MDDKGFFKKINPAAGEPVAYLQVETRQGDNTQADKDGDAATAAPLPSASILALEPFRRARAARVQQRPAPREPVEEHMGRQHCPLYADELAQPMPDRFVELLAQLQSRALKPVGGDAK